jgi:hypothetical protein
MIRRDDAAAVAMYLFITRSNNLPVGSYPKFQIQCVLDHEVE